MALNDIQLEMIGEFQCPGCVSGGPSVEECPSYLPEDEGGCFRCIGHVSGTTISSIGAVYLGLPKGFNRVGCSRPRDVPRDRAHNNIHLWESQVAMSWDRFNVPVWAFEKDGYLFVRTYLPRTNQTFIDVIRGGKVVDIPKLGVPMNVGEFVEEID